MSTSINKYDAIEHLIYEENLRIETIDIHAELDIMLIILNTKAVLYQKISNYNLLKNASKEALLQYEINANGSGVYWPLIDEDLSLKGFLQDELKSLTKSSKAVAA